MQVSFWAKNMTHIFTREHNTITPEKITVAMSTYSMHKFAPFLAKVK